MSFPPRCAARRFPEELAELAFSRVPWFLYLHMFSMRSSAPQLLGKQDLWRLRVSQLVGASTQGWCNFRSAECWGIRGKAGWRKRSVCEMVLGKGQCARGSLNSVLQCLHSGECTSLSPGTAQLGRAISLLIGARSAQSFEA